jgi:hypothetical protein
LVGIETLVAGNDDLRRKPVENVDQFLQALTALFGAQRDSFGDTSLNMVPKNGQADPIEGRLSGRQLLKDFDTQPGFLHHSTDATNLALNPVESSYENLLLGDVEHSGNYDQYSDLFQALTGETK